MSDDQAQLCEVRPMHRFDEAVLREYLADQIPGANQTMSVQQFQGGQSNPTFLLTTPKGRFVMRKKPPGKLLPSAHLVEREYRVMRALESTGVPVPHTRLLCEDPSIIGTTFFVMDHVEGRILERPELDYAGMTPAERRELYMTMTDTLGTLHNVDVAEVGLSDFGKPQDYYARQIGRWSKQYEASCEPPAGGEEGALAMRKLMAWLPANIPADEASGIAHGDFRIGNLIIDPQLPRVAAVLDWELSTLGHPLGDLAYCCIPYHLPAGMNEVKGLRGLDLEALGIPSEEDVLARYCDITGRNGIADWPFYVSFALFRLAAILQGVYSRALMGNASSANALIVGERAGLLAETGWRIANGD